MFQGHLIAGSWVSSFSQVGVEERVVFSERDEPGGDLGQ